MKKGKVILLAAIVLICICAVFLISKPDFIMQDKSELKSVSVVMNPAYEENTLTIMVNDEEEMKRIYDMLDSTSTLKSVKHPDHATSVQWDPEFLIRFEYQNGEIDEFYSTEAKGGIIRFLNTKGSSEDPGYIFGKNEVIYEYIENLKNFM